MCQVATVLSVSSTHPHWAMAVSRWLVPGHMAALGPLRVTRVPSLGMNVCLSSLGRAQAWVMLWDVFSMFVYKEPEIFLFIKTTNMFLGHLWVYYQCCDFLPTRFYIQADPSLDISSTIYCLICLLSPLLLNRCMYRHPASGSVVLSK